MVYLWSIASKWLVDKQDDEMIPNTKSFTEISILVGKAIGDGLSHEIRLRELFEKHYTIITPP